MESTDVRLIVNKEGYRIIFFLLGLFQIGCCTIILFYFISSVINGDIFTQNVWLNLFLLFLVTLSLPAGIFTFSYAFGERKLFEINVTGIKIKNQPLIEWESIVEIKRKIYPGPRMQIYKLKIMQGSDSKINAIIWFTSDIKPNWTEIIDSLNFYTVRHNIRWT